MSLEDPRSIYGNLVYASVNSSYFHPHPVQPRGICSRFQFRGWGICSFIAARGMGICVPQGDSRAFDTCVFESTMEELVHRGETRRLIVEQWLVRQGLEKLVDAFKVFFPILDISSSRVSI